MDLNKLKPVMPPRTAYNYFKREYSKQISKITGNSNEERMWDVTDVWKSLNSEERERVCLRFEESKCRHEIEYAKYLSKLEPYLKKKVEVTRKRKVNNEAVAEREVPTSIHDNQTELDENIFEDNGDQAATGTEILCHNSNQQVDNESAMDDTFHEHIGEKPNSPPKCAKDLFIMTHEDTLEKEACENMWQVMPPQQRSRYVSATRLLKKEFLLKYQHYLERLTNAQLVQLLREKNLEVPLLNSKFE